MLVQVHNKEVLAIPNLLRYVLKFIYDEKNMSASDIRRMQDSIVNWNKAIDLEKEKISQIHVIDVLVYGKVVNADHKYAEEELALQAMCWMLKENEAGRLESRKKLFMTHSIDYRKFHRLPEAYTFQDFMKAEKLVEESNIREGLINDGNNQN